MVWGFLRKISEQVNSFGYVVSLHVNSEGRDVFILSRVVDDTHNFVFSRSTRKSFVNNINKLLKIQIRLWKL